jgi:serine/threonine protein phosphatase PrpC
MKPAILRGREHTNLGAVAAIAEGCCAVALSRGGARKNYAHEDPNEDAAAFSAGEGGFFVAVADGHGGYDASEIAIERLVQHHAPGWTASAASGIDADWPAAASAALMDVNQTLVQRAARGALHSSRTTLAFALVRPGDDLLAFAAIGDSHVFRVDADGVDDLAHPPRKRLAFLGAPNELLESVREKSTANTAGLAGIRALVLVTDGISEPGIGLEAPETAVLEAAERARSAEGPIRALEVARTTVELALAAHRRNGAGDNVASAVAWLDPLE